MTTFVVHITFAIIFLIISIIAFILQCNVIAISVIISPDISLITSLIFCRKSFVEPLSSSFQQLNFIPQDSSSFSIPQLSTGTYFSSFFLKSYRTALIWAAERGEMELVKLLLDKGANTFNPVVLNGVSDCVVESLGEMVGEKDRYKRRGILV